MSALMKSSQYNMTSNKGSYNEVSLCLKVSKENQLVYNTRK